MFFHRLVIFPRTVVITAALFSAAHLGWGDNSVPGRTPESGEDRFPEAKEKSTSSKLFRPYTTANPFSDATQFKPSQVIPAPPQQNTAPFSKGDEERLDRQRNWIFVQPETETKAQSVEEIFKVGRAAEDKKSSSVVSQFLSGGQENVSAWKNEKDKNPFDLSATRGLNGENPENNGPLSRGNLVDPSRDRRVTGFSAEQNKLEELWRDQANVSRQREDRETRMQDFENLFQSSSQNGNGANGKSLNVFGENNFGASPNAASRGVSDRFNPAATGNSADAFRQPARITGASSFEKPDINTRVFGDSATIQKPAEPQKTELPPAVLPFPKRKF